MSDPVHATVTGLCVLWPGAYGGALEKRGFFGRPTIHDFGNSVVRGYSGCWEKLPSTGNHFDFSEASWLASMLDRDGMALNRSPILVPTCPVCAQLYEIAIEEREAEKVVMTSRWERQ